MKNGGMGFAPVCIYRYLNVLYAFLFLLYPLVFLDKENSKGGEE